MLFVATEKATNYQSLSLYKIGVKKFYEVQIRNNYYDNINFY